MSRAFVAGAGLAGAEAAWQLASRGIPVTLAEMKPEKRLFTFSVLYLFTLFAALVADRMILGQGAPV